MPFDFLEPALNSVYLFLGIVGFLGSFIGWLYTRQQTKRQEDKNELIAYVDNKFDNLTKMQTNTTGNLNEKLDHSNNLLTKILQYETRNIKLHIKNLTITDERLEADIARIEGLVLFKNPGQEKDRSLSYKRKKHNNQDEDDDVDMSFTLRRDQDG